MTPTQRMPTIVDALPKAELHLHLEGTIRPETAVELAARHDVKILLQDIAKRYLYHDFLGFIEAFKWVTSFLREPDDYRLIVQRACEELIRQNVVYAEFTISTGVMLRRMQNVEANFEAMVETANSVPYRKLRTGWIFDNARQWGAEAAMEVARWSVRLQKAGVIAFGMGGDELAFPTVNFRPAFDHARNAGLRVVCHAGEIGGPDSVREAIDILGAERIGHGIAVMNDPELGKSLAMRKVVLENCPTSNICTGALAKQIGRPVATLADHPLKAFVDRGVPVTLSTDDPGMFHTDLLTEYSIAASLGLSNPQLLHLAEQSFNSAFLTPEEKRRYLDNFHAAAKSGGLV